MKGPKLIWEVGTAYDLFVSLEVLHDPSRYGLRGSWAAGVRSRLPADSREFLQNSLDNGLWALPWLAELPGPKDGASVLAHIADLPASKRWSELTSCGTPDEAVEVLQNVQARGEWRQSDLKRLRRVFQPHFRKKGKKKVSDELLTHQLKMWVEAEKTGEELLEALKTYYDVFFAEEEHRIEVALAESLQKAKALSEQMELSDLLEELSQGLRYDFQEAKEMETLRMVPSFWTTPLALYTSLSDEKNWLFMFGGRPPDMSLVPGETVPELLYQALKALADPTRLRILRYLSEEPLTPAELARRLRLRSPTVLHHLDALRLARLVHVTLSYEGRKYAARREGVATACEMLQNFLEQE